MNFGCEMESISVWFGGGKGWDKNANQVAKACKKVFPYEVILLEDNIWP